MGVSLLSTLTEDQCAVEIWTLDFSVYTRAYAGLNLRRCCFKPTAHCKRSRDPLSLRR